jgi:predicted transcriptional regulator
VLLSLEAFKQQKFDQVATKMDDPESYLAFESVSDSISQFG